MLVLPAVVLELVAEVAASVLELYLVLVLDSAEFLYSVVELLDTGVSGALVLKQFSLLVGGVGNLA